MPYVTSNIYSPQSMDVSVGRLMTSMRWFPRTIFNVPRQTGKTRALLSLIHEDHQGKAILISPTSQMSAMARHHYLNLFGGIEEVKFITSGIASDIRGSLLPVYVDEWYMFKESDMIKLEYITNIMGRVGSER